MLKSKTTWTCLLGALGGLAGIFTSELSVAEGAQVILTSLIGLFLRHGVAKNQMAAEKAVEAASVPKPVAKKRIIKKGV
jgi:hypothetical protein